MNQIASPAPVAYTQTTVYVLHANKGYIGGDYKLTFATPELRDAHEVSPGHRKLATGREFRYSDADHSKPASLEQRIQQAAREGDYDTAVGLASCLPAAGNDDAKAEAFGVAFVAHTFTSKDGSQFTMSRKRDGSIVTAAQYRDHHRVLSSAFTGVLADRAGYRGLYQLETIKTAAEALVQRQTDDWMLHCELAELYGDR